MSQVQVIQCPACKKETLEVHRNVICPGVSVHCRNCGFLDGTTKD